MESADHAVGSFVGATSDRVSYCGAGQVHDFEALLPGSKAPVNVFAVHEILGIEEPNLGDHLTRRQQGRSGDPVHFSRLVMRPVGHKVVAGKSVFWEEFPQWGVAEQGSNGIWKSSTTHLERTVRVQQPWSEHTDIGSGLQKLKQVSNCIVVDDRVGVEE